jgi:hypothetical protein
MYKKIKNQKSKNKEQCSAGGGGGMRRGGSVSILQTDDERQ